MSSGSNRASASGATENSGDVHEIRDSPETPFGVPEQVRPKASLLFPEIDISPSLQYSRHRNDKPELLESVDEQEAQMFNSRQYTVDLEKPVSADGTQNVMLNLDDAASSICIDEEDYDSSDLSVEHAMNVLKNSSGKPKLLRNTSNITDFDRYNQQVARDFILKQQQSDQHRQRNNRRRRVRKSVYDSRHYGNYFNTGGAYEGSNSQAIKRTHHHHQAPLQSMSYNFDNFDGGRQNTRYNRQLNLLNSALTREEQRKRLASSLGDNKHSGLTGFRDGHDDSSFITTNIDDMDEQFSDGYEDNYRFDGPEPVPTIKRGLYSRQIQMMALCGGIGVGLLLNSGYTLYVSGPLGTLLGYMFTGLMVSATMASFGEVISLIPVDGTISRLVSRFVDDSLGFTVAVVYFFCSAISLPAEITAATILLSYYPILDMSTQGFVVWLTLFIIIVLIISLMDIEIWGNLQYISCLISLMFFVALFITLCAMNNGALGPLHDKVGFRYWDSSKSNETLGEHFGLFRPTFTLVMSASLANAGAKSISSGVAGSTGRFLQIWHSVCTSAFSYVGTEGIFVTAAEVRNPRKAIPAATKRTFIKVVMLYILAMFLLSINVYAGETLLVGSSTSGAYYLSDAAISRHDLSKTVSDSISDTVSAGLKNKCLRHPQILTVSNDDNALQGPKVSPSILALREAGLCAFSDATNAFFVFFSLVGACDRVYTASRTLYGASQGVKKMAWLRKCNSSGVPYVAVVVSWLFSLLAYLTDTVQTDKVFNWFVGMSTSAALLVWASMNLAFLRFFWGLKLRPDIRSRDDLSYPYKSPLQPYTAYFGLISNILVCFFLGATLFVRDFWDGLRFFTQYFAVFLFIVCYVGHKLITRCSVVPLSELDLDSGRKSIENTPWAEDRVYELGLQERLKKLLMRLSSLRGAFSKHDEA